MSDRVTIYSDGGSKPNPGPGGWAALLIYGEHEAEISGGDARTTNNQMELTAAIKALEALTRPCEVDFYTDSQYVRQGITEWINGWRKNGWMTSAKKPVLNKELWIRLYELTQQHQIKWHWTRGHAGDKFNERVDQLATEARLNISGDSLNETLTEQKPMSKMSDRVAEFGTTIFTEINNLAQQHNALNLGQGKPDFDGPPDVIAAAVRALQSGTHNQYAPGPGVPSFRQAIAAHASRFYNLDVDPNAGVVVTAGATEAVFSSVLGLVDRGDEVIVIEPYFDSYVPNITMAGATPVYVPLHPPAWTFDPDELRKAFNSKTRVIILNTPHNPTGRVFTLAEMTLIADLCKEFDVTVISDEVYEHLIFDSARHIPMATLPGMFERTVTISSLGKSYSVTGWKIGWVYGAPELVTGVARAHQFVTFAVNHPAQEAGAYALSLPGTYYEDFQAMYTAKRDLMMGALTNAGLKARQPEGTYFVMADFADVFDGDDIDFARYLTSEIGVACIPPTFFYSTGHAHMASTQARFAFCKSDDLLREAGARLAGLVK